MRGQFTSTDALWTALWANGGLADAISQDARVPHGLNVNLTSEQGAAVARGYAKPEENQHLLAALEAVLGGKQA